MGMFGLGAAELMVLLLLSSGGNMPDALSIFPARDYFKIRGIETTQEKLIEIAGQDPTTPKAQIMQLQALRLLAEEPKVDPVILKVVRDIAAGNRANDKNGFARNYARKVMAAVDGKTVAPMIKAKAAEGLEWFPADAGMAGVVDFRLARIPGVPAAPAEPAIWKVLPAKIKRQVLEKAFEVLEQTGNIEVHRGSVALAWEGRKGDFPRVYARFSGNFNQDWVLKTLQSLTPLKFESAKGPAGEEYQFTAFENIAFAFLNGNEVLLAADPDRREAGRCAKMLAEMMEIKAGKKDSVLKGKRLKDLLAKVPADALGLFVMELPDEAKAIFGLLEGKVAAPDKVILFATPALRAIDIQLEGMMQNEDDAKTSVKGIFQFREMGIQQLKMAEGNVPIPGFSTRPFIQILESLQVEAKGSSVHMRLLLPEEVVRGIVDMMMRAIPQDFEGLAPEKNGARLPRVRRPAA